MRTRTTTSTRFFSLHAREPASFWRENEIAVVILQQGLARMSQWREQVIFCCDSDECCDLDLCRDCDECCDLYEYCDLEGVLTLMSVVIVTSATPPI